MNIEQTLVLYKVLNIMFLLLAVRTMLFWLQQWQIREYRWDRLKDHLFHTKEGRTKLWNLWFFKGLLPRPKRSGRILITLGILFIYLSGAYIGLQLFLHGPQNHAYLNACGLRSVQPIDGIWENTKCFFLGQPYESPLTLIIIERLLWLFVGLAVLTTKPLVRISQKRLFLEAFFVVQNAEAPVTRIALSGSFGKSSTKELLVQCLKDHYGEDHVLYNPENHNNEVAIARLITNNKDFFKGKNQKVLVIETGAYKQKEVERICQVVQPQYGIITGLNTQHLSLFGSVKKMQLAETELAHACEEKVFFNGDNTLLKQSLLEQDYEAKDHIVEKRSAQNINTDLQKTSFSWEGKDFELPWPGEFFINNALLALSMARELQIPFKTLQHSLKNMPPLKRALHVEQHPQWFWILKDPYSANPDGVMAAIEHLKLVKGRKIFVGIPLIELGKEAYPEHEKIFKALKECEAEVFWLKKDFAALGKEICDKRWHGKNLRLLEKTIKELKLDDGILLESRIPGSIDTLLEPTS